MEYRTLGRTGVHVSPLCLGNMMLGSWGNPDHDDAIRIIHRALDAGINFIDTADVYSAGESEFITGKALAGGRRDDVILATKCHFQVEASGAPSTRTGAPPPNVSGSSRRYIIKACEASLRRLGPDWSDLYQVPPPPAPRPRLDRSVPDPPARPVDRHRRDPRGVLRPRTPGQDPRLRFVDVPG